MKKNIKYLILLIVLFLIPVFNAHASSLSDRCILDCNSKDIGSGCYKDCIHNVEGKCGSVCNGDTTCEQNCIKTYVNSDYHCTDDACFDEFTQGFYMKTFGNNGSSVLTCDDVKHVTMVYTALRILAPFLLIIYGSLDFFKAITAGDEKKQKEARSKFPKRIIAFLLLIILPFAVSFIVTTFGVYGSSNTSLFCCIVSGGNSVCNFNAYYSVDHSYEESTNGSGNGGNNSNNSTSGKTQTEEITAENLCNSGSSYIAPKSKTVSVSISECINDYYGKCKNVNIETGDCKCEYKYISDVPSNLCTSNCGVGKSGSTCYYNVEHVSSQPSSSDSTIIKSVKTSSGWDVYHSYNTHYENGISDEKCRSTYNGICYGTSRESCTCVYEKK